MTFQIVIVAGVVIACSVYAAWTLMPAGARRIIAERLLALSPPEALAAPLRRAAKPAGACGGCDNCGDAQAAKPASQVQPITFHRPLPR